ncbi:MAG: hypothetical protein ACM3JQ_00430 [Candidatus Eiseniibacteriota bacterium]
MKNLFGEDILFLRTLNSIMFILVSSIPTLGNSVSFAGVSSQELQSTGNSTSGGVNYNSGESTITNPDGSLPTSTVAPTLRIEIPIWKEANFVDNSIIQD